MQKALIAFSAALALLLARSAMAGPDRSTLNPQPSNAVKGLPGWHVQNGNAELWVAEGNLITCKPGRGGYLTTDKEYGDFELSLEYRLPPGGNSGIGVHYPPGGHPSEKGIEIQLLDDDHAKYKNLKPAQYNCSIYRLVAPKARAAKPAGEWNKLVIRCKGPTIEVRLNDVEIQKVNADEHTTADGERSSLSQRPRKGCIGLQSHSDPVEFRNVTIRALK